MYFAFNNGIPLVVILGEIYLVYSNPANFEDGTQNLTNFYF